MSFDHLDSESFVLVCFGVFSSYMFILFILVSTNSTNISSPDEGASPGALVELRMFAQSIAFDLSDIVAGFKLGPQQLTLPLPVDCCSFCSEHRRFVGLEFVVFLVTLVAAFAWRLRWEQLVASMGRTHVMLIQNHSFLYPHFWFVDVHLCTL